MKQFSELLESLYLSARNLIEKAFDVDENERDDYIRRLNEIHDSTMNYIMKGPGCYLCLPSYKNEREVASMICSNLAMANIMLSENWLDDRDKFIKWDVCEKYFK